MEKTVERAKDGCLGHIGNQMTDDDWKTLAEFFAKEAVARAEANEGLFDSQEYAFAAIAAFRALGGAEKIPPSWVLYHLSGRGFPLPDPLGQKVGRLMSERRHAHELLPQIGHVTRAANNLFKQVDMLKKEINGLGSDTEEE